METSYDSILPLKGVHRENVQLADPIAEIEKRFQHSEKNQINLTTTQVQSKSSDDSDGEMTKTIDRLCQYLSNEKRSNSFILEYLVREKFYRKKAKKLNCFSIVKY